MSASFSESPREARWRADAPDAGAEVDAVVHGWLTGPGLLTQRLSACCPDTFRLEVLDNRATGEDGLHRAIMLSCDGRACVYAESDVPAATLDALPWLRELGDAALGETLREHGATRSPFEYRRYRRNEQPRAISALAEGPVWARRSDFVIGDASLTVTEWFLNALTACDEQRIRLLNRSA